MTKLSTSLFVMLFLFISTENNAQVNPTVLEQIDGFFSQWDNNHSPGAAVGVFQNGKILFSKGYGMANLDYGIPIDTESKFYVASIAKQFTAACIALLSIDKKLDLNDDIRKYIPEIPEYEHTITIKNLLHHTSGIRDYLGIMYISGRSFQDYSKNDDVINMLSKQKALNFIPGSQHRYTNSGYVLLAEIVNRVSGMTIREFAANRLFKPLGMVNTFFKDDRSEIIKNRVIGYQHHGESAYKRNLINFDKLGDGNLITTINDMMLWNENFYHKKVGGQKFVDLMLTKGILNNGKTISYAFGLFHGDYKGYATVSHNGNMLGFGIEFLRIPEQHTAVVVMSNSSNINATGQAYKIADLFIKDRTKQIETVLANEVISSEVFGFKTIKVSPKNLTKYNGLFWNDNSNYSRRIYLKNDTLRYARSIKNESALVPIGKDKFRMLGSSSKIIIKFELKKNVVSKMVFSIDEDPPETLHVYKPINYTPEELVNFSGSYYSTELDCIYEMKMKNDALYLHINGNELYSPEIIKKNTFDIGGPYGIIKFEETTMNSFTLDSFGMTLRFNKI